MKPQYYCEKIYERVDDYSRPQPVPYINGARLSDYKQDSFEVQNYGELYWESYKYKYALDTVNYFSPQWLNEEIKDRCFNFVYDFIKMGGNKKGSSITPLFPFEIYLLNNEFELTLFTELNAIKPGTRVYQKDNLRINVNFGCETPDREINFYFMRSDNGFIYEVPINESDFEKVLNNTYQSI